jgi:Zn finger protein HypA/HybF involved in hydrogenase expression
MKDWRSNNDYFVIFTAELYAFTEGLMRMPTNVTRATGVIEKLFKCNACNHTFRSPNALNAEACPQCGSPQVQPAEASHLKIAE